MFSNLALIDWIALVFAAVLLAAAAAAGIVAYATAKNRPVRSLTPIGHRPAHANPPAPTGQPVPGPHATSAEVAAGRASATDDTDYDGIDYDGAGYDEVPSPPILVGNRAPQPEMLSAPAHARSSVMSNGVELEASVVEESVAARAAKLRRRPRPDTDGGHKRIVSSVEPKRMPAHAPNRAFEHASSSGGQLTIDKDHHTEGFAARTPGFFEDPVGRHELRYWDGHRWTEYVKEHGERFTDPL